MHQADVIIIGAGLAGIAAALEVLDQGKRVVMYDAAPEDALGGLARWSFGGIFLVNSKEQRLGRIKDSVESALADWNAFAEFGPQEQIQEQWAEFYVSRCTDAVGDWLRQHGVRFIPGVHWTERGMFVPGNSVPRFHIVWGTGHGLVRGLIKPLRRHIERGRLTIHFKHRVTGFEHEAGRLVGCVGIDGNARPFAARAGEAIVIASGGFAGNFDRVRANWPIQVSPPPETLLNGSHPYADGEVMALVQALGGRITNLDHMWHYANGIRHWQPAHPDHGLSVAVPRSALWVGYDGRRLGPPPLLFNYDAGYLTEAVCQQPKPVSWVVMNRRIADKELAISGSEFNHAMREKRLLATVWGVLFGNPSLIKELIDHCEDVVVADSVRGLAAEMNAVAGNQDVDPGTLVDEVARFDQNVSGMRNDDQLRRIDHARRYLGDRLRTLKRAPIDDPSARPLIAIRQRVLTRKSLGGIQTDLQSRVLDEGGQPIEGLYAVGESAGFGGGGVHGRRSLEGTFLGACILTGRVAGRSITGRTL